MARGAIWDARTGRARGAVTARSSCVRWRSGALTGGSVVAGRRQGATGELTGATGRASGKAVGGGAHPNDIVAWRRWRILQAVAFVVREGAPVAGGDGGTALQCWCRRRKVRAASNGDNDGGWKGLTVKR
jgi:hypothetical protein